MTNIWTIFGRQNTLDITLLVSVGLWIGHELRNVRILHLYQQQGRRDDVVPCVARF